MKYRVKQDYPKKVNEQIFIIPKDTIVEHNIASFSTHKVNISNKELETLADWFEFVEGKKVKWLPFNNCGEYIRGDYYDLDGDALFVRDNKGDYAIIYRNGEWAEIIKEEEKIMVGSYEVKFGADYIVVGCKRYSELDVLNLLSAMEYLKITSIEIAGVKVPLETVKKIAERLK